MPLLDTYLLFILPKYSFGEHKLPNEYLGMRLRTTKEEVWRPLQQNNRSARLFDARIVATIHDATKIYVYPSFMLPRRRCWKAVLEKFGGGVWNGDFPKKKRGTTLCSCRRLLHLWTLKTPIFKSVKSTVGSFTLRSSNFNHCKMVKDGMSSNVSCDMFALVAHT